MACATIEVTSDGTVGQRSNRAEQLVMQHPANGTRSRSLIIVWWPWTGRRSDRSHEYCGCRAVSGPRIYSWTSRTGSGRSSGTPSTLIDNWMCVVRHNRDYRVSRPETRSADHLEPEPNFTSRGVYDFRIQKGHRTGRGARTPDTR